jgi:hypothetical protein
MRLRILVSAAIVLAPQQSQAQGPVTLANWNHHPAILTVRAIYREVEAASKNGTLTEVTDSASCNGGEVGVVAHLYFDSNGRVRKYVVEGGSGDSYSQAFYYYDEKGILRFTFIQLGAVNGTNRDDRFYFDSTGSLLHKSSKLVHGPGYPGGTDSVVVSPRDDFAHLCGQAEQ